MLPLPLALAVMVKGLTAKLAEMVWFAVTFEKLYVVTAPADTPSTSTVETWYPVEGVIVKVWFAPLFTETAPAGEMLPLPLALTVMVNGFAAKLAEMVWFAVTFVKLYDVTAPAATPSTSTAETWYPVAGLIVYVWLAP
jgi:hypothetical protein